MNVSISPISAYVNILPNGTGVNRVVRDGRASHVFSAEDQQQLVQSRAQGKTISVEKIIEGELLENSQGTAGLTAQYSSVSNNAFVDLLPAQRFFIRGENLSDTQQQRSIQTAGEGINAYLRNTGLNEVNNTNSTSSRIDIFV